MNEKEILILGAGLVIGSLVTFGAFVLNGELEPQQFTKNEVELAEILEGQMKLAGSDFSCDIDVLKHLHDKPVCLSKLDVLTPTKLGYILHENTVSSHMWYQDDEVMKIRGESSGQGEYNGTLNQINVNGKDYYLITNAKMQDNDN